MTLCIAAACIEDADIEKQRIIISADTRLESKIASADISSKYLPVSKSLWALYCGDPAEAEKFVGTCRETIASATLDSVDALYRTLMAASAAYKERLCENYARLKFGISYERVLTKGRRELPENNRSRFFHDLWELDYECELLLVGFVGLTAVMFHIDDRGEVQRQENFRAIGSGAAVGEGDLFFRKQRASMSVERALYCVYESARLAYEATAPGVGETRLILKLAREGEGLRVDRITSGCSQVLSRLYEKKYGPRKLKDGEIPAGLNVATDWEEL